MRKNDIGVIAEMPAWSSNRLKRLARSPKRYVADTGLWGAAIRAGLGLVMSDGDLLGRLIDTFVANQLRAEAATDPARPQLYHLRDRDGRHMDQAVPPMRAVRAASVRRPTVIRKVSRGRVPMPSAESAGWATGRPGATR